MLKSLARVKISKKLPVIMIGLTALNVFAVTGLQQYLIYEDTIKSTEHELSAYGAAKKAELTNYLADINEDLATTGSSPMLAEAARDFDAAWRSMGSEAGPALQAAYKGKSAAAATDENLYSMVHAKYDSWFGKYQAAKGYHDVFLVNASGDVVYSVHKDQDFATSLDTGAWKDTDLAKTFRDLKADPKAGQTVFYDFREYAANNNEPESFIGVPIMEDGSFLGAMIVQMPADEINKIAAEADDLGEKSSVYIVGEDLMMRSNYRFAKEPTIMKWKVDQDSVKKAIGGETGVVIEEGKFSKENSITAFTPVNANGKKWALIASIEEREVLAHFRHIQMVSIICSLSILFVIALISIWYARRLTKPINAMVGTMKTLADGNNAVSVPSLERHDEIGDMAKAVQVFKENALEMERMEIETEKNKQRAEAEKRAGMNKLADDFDSRTSSVIMSLTAASSQMQQTAERMTDASERTSEISSAVAAAATQADANVQTVAAATEELTASAREIAQQINMVSNMAGNAADEAENTSREVKNLQEMAVSIGEVVGSIKEIAEQTNLLALNATIEAARAGEAGKGFAVVADEVKKLANETAQKTEEIDGRVTAIRNAINSSVQAMDKIIRNVKSIDEATTSVTAAVEEQNAATGEIGRNVSEASTGTQQVSQNIVTVQENAYATGEASKTVLQAAGELSKLSVELRTQVAGFLTEIRGDGAKEASKKTANTNAIPLRDLPQAAE